MKEIFTRRSVRSYTEETVSQQHIELLLKAAMRAPSAGNAQPWQFVVLQNRGTLLEITKISPYAGMLKQAPCAIVVCGDASRERYPGYWVQDCSAATQNILLEAVHLGLGAVWLGFHPIEERVNALKELLGLPAHITPLGIVSVGHPDAEPKPVDTYEPERVHWERWDG